LINDKYDEYDPAQLELLESEEAKNKTNQDEKIRQVLYERKQAYFRLFGGAAMPGDKATVLKDLSWFCHGDRTPWHDNPRIHALISGRNEVYRRITDFLELSMDDLIRKYTNRDG